MNQRENDLPVSVPAAVQKPFKFSNDFYIVIAIVFLFAVFFAAAYMVQRRGDEPAETPRTTAPSKQKPKEFWQEVSLSGGVAEVWGGSSHVIS